MTHLSERETAKGFSGSIRQNFSGVETCERQASTCPVGPTSDPGSTHMPRRRTSGPAVFSSGEGQLSAQRTSNVREHAWFQTRTTSLLPLAAARVLVLPTRLSGEGPSPGPVPGAVPRFRWRLLSSFDGAPVWSGVEPRLRRTRRRSAVFPIVPFCAPPTGSAVRSPWLKSRLSEGTCLLTDPFLVCARGLHGAEPSWALWRGPCLVGSKRRCGLGGVPASLVRRACSTAQACSLPGLSCDSGPYDTVGARVPGDSSLGPPAD